MHNPDKIFPNLQKEFCIHPPDKVNPLLYPFGGMLSLRHCTPYQQSTSSPQLPMASHIGLHEYASPAPMRHHNPFPLPLRPLVSHIWTARVCVTRSNEIPKSLPLISLTSPEPTKHLWLPGSSLSPHELRDLNPTLPYKYMVATFSLTRNYLTR